MLVRSFEEWRRDDFFKRHDGVWLMADEVERMKAAIDDDGVAEAKLAMDLFLRGLCCTDFAQPRKNGLRYAQKTQEVRI